jgi:hypothetical protein
MSNQVKEIIECYNGICAQNSMYGGKGCIVGQACHNHISREEAEGNDKEKEE